MNDKKRILTQIYDDIKKLGYLSSNATHRRALAVIAEEINKGELQPLRVPCPGDGPNFVDETERETLIKLDFDNAYYEIDEDTNRKSFFSDPTENLAAIYVDFYSGKIEKFEVRESNSFDEIDRIAQDMAVKFIKKYKPKFKIDFIKAKSKTETVAELRSIAFYLENNQNGDFSINDTNIGTLVDPGCIHSGFEFGSTRWVENGLKLEQRIRDEYKCYSRDTCCGNRAVTRQYGPWQWRTIWEDYGNAASPPPSVPPLFERYPWKNHCMVFPGPVNAEVVSDWGWRNIDGQLNFHGGIDLAVPAGTEVIASEGGIIRLVRRGNKNGEVGVVIQNGQDTITYWHVDPDVTLLEGMQIVAGQRVGLVALWARPHLHFARHRPPGGDWTKRSDGNSMDPCPMD